MKEIRGGEACSLRCLVCLFIFCYLSFLIGFSEQKFNIGSLKFMFWHPKVVLFLESTETEQLALLLCFFYQPSNQRPPPIKWSCLSR